MGGIDPNDVDPAKAAATRIRKILAAQFRELLDSAIEQAQSEHGTPVFGYDIFDLYRGVENGDLLLLLDKDPSKR